MRDLPNLFTIKNSHLINSAFNPPGPNNLEYVFDRIMEEILSYKPIEPRVKNITKDEQQALTSLRKNKNLVIKPADKGSAIVVMNRSDYLEEGFRQLSNTQSMNYKIQT